MLSHFKPLSVVLIILLCSGPLLWSDSLWDKALAHADVDLENTDPLAGMNMNGIRVNKAGEIIQISSMVINYNGETGELTIESAFEDDKDVTEKMQRRVERSRRDREDEEEPIFIHSIFNPEKSAGLTLSNTGEEASIGAYQCLIYTFRMENEQKLGPGRPKKTIEEGRVFLDLETGMPIRLESTLIEGPNIIHNMSFVMNAFSDPDGRWRPDNIELVFAGHLFIYMAGTMNMSFRYSDL